MPRVKDLMEVGLTPIQSKHLGAQAVNGDFNNLTAVGNASQANAYQIEANYNIFTTVGATTNSAKLPIAESDPHGVYFILNLGANALNLYPALGDNFNDLAANAAIAIPVDCGAILVKQTDLSWQVHNTWGAVSPSILSGFVPYTGATGNVDLGAFDLSVADEAYGTGWNGSLEVPTKNAVYDKIESLPVLASGTYTPTLTNTTNIAASTAFPAQYMRVGSVVTVSGRMNIDPTAAGYVVIRLSLPIASNFTSFDNCGGVAAMASTSQTAALSGLSSSADDLMFFEGVVPTAANIGFVYTFTYTIL